MKAINLNAPIVCRCCIEITSNKQNVWSALTDIDRWNEWQSTISKSSLKGPVKTGSVFRWKSGGMEINSEINGLGPGKSIGWKGISLGVKAQHNWYLEELKNGVRLTSEESMEGILAILFKKMLGKQLKHSLQIWLGDLKKHVESNAG